MTALKRLRVFQLYPPKTKFKKKYGWKYALMHMIFDVQQQDLQKKDRIVVVGNVVDSTDHTTYSYTIKDVPVRLMRLISVQNGL